MTVVDGRPSKLLQAEELPYDVNKRRQSPAFLAVSEAVDPSRSAGRSASPTFLAVQQMESGGGGKQAAMYQELKDGEEIRYQGYTNPRKQSRSFHMLEHGLGMSSSDSGSETGVTCVL